MYLVYTAHLVVVEELLGEEEGEGWTPAMRHYLASAVLHLASGMCDSVALQSHTHTAWTTCQDMGELATFGV